MPDRRQLRPVHRQYVRPEIRLGPKPGGLPVLENAVRGRCRIGVPGRENADEDIRAFDQVGAARYYHRRTNFCFKSTGQHADHDIAGLQCESWVSSASSRFKDAARKSWRSSSDHESDQSILPAGESVASRWARAVSSVAVSGARRRNASTSDASRGFSCMSMIL